MYVIEPHPNGSRSPYKRGTGWQEWWQDYATSMYPTNPPLAGDPVSDVQDPLFQPRTFKERVARAKNLIQHKAITTPILIDEMDNPYWSTYGYMPNCAYLIDKNGTVVERQTWFLPGDPNSISSIETAIQNLRGL